MKTLTEMSERELQTAYDKALAATSKASHDLINAGRGNERASETRAKNDPLAEKWKAVHDVFNAVNDERASRMRYHGSYKPIRKKHWL